ncbi:MAG: oligosaccharide flippase family protein [Planctomycetota bacterium]
MPELPPSATTMSASQDPRAGDPQRIGTDPTDHRRTAVSGVVWASLGIAASQILRLGGNVVLAHQLFESAFGVMALVNVFWTGMQLFSDLGVWRSVTQHPRGNEPQFLNTAWTVQALRGVALWVVCCILAWPYASYYDEPMLAPYILVSGLTAVFDGLRSPSLMVLRRQVSVGSITVMNVGAQLVSIVTMITWAAISPTVWALVAGLVAGGGFSMIFSHTWMRLYRPRFQLDRETLRELLKIGKWVFLSTALSFLAAQGDRLLLGKLVDKDEFGLFCIALGLCGIVTMLAHELLQNVVFPLISREQKDAERVAEKFLRARGMMLGTCSGSCAAIVLGSPLFFGFLYDDRYIDSGWQAQWICLSLWFQVMAMGLELVPFALGNARVSFLGGCVRMTGIPLAYIGFQMRGIPGFVIGFAISNLLALLALTACFPRKKAAVLGQSLSYSLGAGAYVALALLVAAYVETRWSWRAGAASRALLAAIPLAWSGWYALQQLLRRRASANS